MEPGTSEKECQDVEVCIGERIAKANEKSSLYKEVSGDESEKGGSEKEVR